MRLILLVLGLVALFWEAPWFAVLRKSLWVSALFRRLCRVGVTLLRGELYSVIIEANKGPNDIGITTGWQTSAQIWKDSKTEDALSMKQNTRAKSLSAAGAAANETDRGRSRSVIVDNNNKGIEKYEEDMVEIQYLFCIFENQVSHQSSSIGF